MGKVISHRLVSGFPKESIHACPTRNPTNFNYQEVATVATNFPASVGGSYLSTFTSPPELLAVARKVSRDRRQAGPYRNFGIRATVAFHGSIVVALTAYPAPQIPASDMFCNL